MAPREASSLVVPATIAALTAFVITQLPVAIARAVVEAFH
jgi:hypothetical protein